MEGTKGIGLTVNTMVMELRHGQEEADTEVNTGRALGMDLACIDSTQAMFMLENGQMGKAMDVGFIHVKMAVGMSGSSSGESSMASAITISETEMSTLGSILGTKCTGLAYIDLEMDIGMKDLGMRAADKGLGCIHLEVGRLNLAIGIMESLISQVHRLTLSLLLQSIIPKYSMQFRKQEGQPRKLMMWVR